MFSNPMRPVAASMTAAGDGASATDPVARSAARMSRVPAPVTRGSPTAGLRADSISRALIVPGLSAGSCSSINATVPATIGDAMLVPDISKYSWTSGRFGSAATRRSGNSES